MVLRLDVALFAVLFEVQPAAKANLFFLQLFSNDCLGIFELDPDIGKDALFEARSRFCHIQLSADELVYQLAALKGLLIARIIDLVEL